MGPCLASAPRTKSRVGFTLLVKHECSHLTTNLPRPYPELARTLWHAVRAGRAHERRALAFRRLSRLARIVFRADEHVLPAELGRGQVVSHGARVVGHAGAGFAVVSHGCEHRRSGFNELIV